MASMITPCPIDGRTPSWNVPGTVLNAIARRFHPLIATIARVRSTNSLSVECCRARPMISRHKRRGAGVDLSMYPNCTAGPRLAL